MAASVPSSHNSVMSSAAKSSSSSSSSGPDMDNIKVNVQMPDVKARKTVKANKKNIVYFISKEDMEFLKNRTRFTEADLREWHQNFREECPEGILNKETIMKIYDEISPFGNSKDFVDNIFRIFDKDGDGTIDFKEFMLATDMTASGTPEEKLRWAFKMYDKDGSGTIEQDEMIDVMGALQHFEGPRGKDAAAARGKRIFSELDINDDGSITCEEFVKGCMQDPELVRIVISGGVDPVDD